MTEPVDRYDYAIRTEVSTRPMGTKTHIGKVTRMVDRKLQVDIPASQFGETWGENANDAHDKMVEAEVAPEIRTG